MITCHENVSHSPEHSGKRRTRRTVLGQATSAGIAAGIALAGTVNLFRLSASAVPLGATTMTQSLLSQPASVASPVSVQATTPDPLLVAPGDGEVFDFTPSEQFVWKATAATTGGAFDIFESFMQPGVPGAPEHIHDANDEIFYVIEGEFRFKIGEEIAPAPAGTFAYVPKGTAHSWVNVDAGVSRLLTQFLPGGMQGFFEAATDLIQTVPLDLAGLEAVTSRYNTRLVGPPLLP